MRENISSGRVPCNFSVQFSLIKNPKIIYLHLTCVNVTVVHPYNLSWNSALIHFYDFMKCLFNILARQLVYVHIFLDLLIIVDDRWVRIFLDPCSSALYDMISWTSFCIIYSTMCSRHCVNQDLEIRFSTICTGTCKCRYVQLHICLGKKVLSALIIQFCIKSYFDIFERCILVQALSTRVQ